MKQFIKTILNFFKDNWFKVGIILAVLACGGFIYQSQVAKQQSIEWQQQQELRAKKEQTDKEYAASQKKACMDIYETEGKKYNNVNSWDYDSFTDTCEITYNLSASEKKSKAQCEKGYNDAKELYKGKMVPMYVSTAYFQCLDGTFTKEF